MTTKTIQFEITREELQENFPSMTKKELDRYFNCKNTVYAKGLFKSYFYIGMRGVKKASKDFL